MYGCESYRICRRSLLKAGAVGSATLLGLRLQDLVAMADEPAARAAAHADHVILLWMAGGMSHIDTLDPKPGRPTAGEFQPIATSADGIQISEVLPTLARQMHRASIIRSMTNTEGDHGRATYNVLTSYKITPQFIHPSIGSVVAREKTQIGDLPSFISIGGRALSSGYLGQACEAYYVGQAGQPDPYLQLPEYIGQLRHERRMEMLRDLNRRQIAKLPGHDQEGVDLTWSAAERFMASEALKAFDIDKETPETLARYGETPFGRGCLLARRLVESGVRFVQVNQGGFDTHSNNFPAMRRLGGIIDPALASLLEDLAATGKLERTLVMLISEFGRTPNVNPSAGRDHYPRVFSTLLAGGGVKAGHIIGASCEDGRQPAEKPVRVGDLHSTVCHLLGVDPDKKVHTDLGRPMRLVEGGSIIKDLLL